LAEHFIGDKTLDPSALAVLARHQWPGNVRELKTLADRLVALLDQPTITGADVIHFLDAPCSPREAPEDVAAALAAHDWNVRAAAQTLGVGHNKIYRLIRKYRLTRPSKSVPRDAGHGPWDTVPFPSEP
jgi:transcriptional regulator of acetoin/glycerol metabolism